MNGFLAIIPLLIIRFGVLSILDKNALKRAAHFAPLIGKERSAYWVYQITNLLIFAALCFLKIRTDSYLIYPGLVIYGLGVLLCLLSVIHFAEPAKSGINSRGIYGISRNPMYVSLFRIFYRLCNTYTVFTLIGYCDNFSDICSLDNPIGGKMVYTEIW